MHNIDDFKSEVGKSGGFAINNLFRVFLPPLKGDSRSLDVLCKAHLFQADKSNLKNT